MTAEEIIAELGMAPHPEGGWYVELWRGDEEPRAAYSSIYFLLKRGERSHWHRVDAAEIWHYHAGAPLLLKRAASDAGPAEVLRLGTDLAAGERPQHLIRPGEWQAAETTGDWTLVGCTVAPGFELAALGFDIPLE